MPFGQLVIGSPGSGKTTYCHGLQQFLAALKRPNVHIVNLDFANQKVPYKASIDVNELVSVKDVMTELDLGPNGATLYCVEYLEQNLEWLLRRIEALGSEAYVVLDLPGQVELSTNHPSLTRIVQRLDKEAQMRLVAVHLLDSTHILDPSRYVALLLLSLRAMLHLELPHINVLTKLDLLGPTSGGQLPFPLEFYTDPNPDELRLYLSGEGSGGSDDPVSTQRRKRYDALNERIIEIVDDFSLVGFETLAVEDKESMWHLVRTVDKVGGWVFVHAQGEGDGDDDDDDEEMPEDLRKALQTEQYLDSLDKPSSSSAASALSLFTTLDSGHVPGWGSAADVQERYLDPYTPDAMAEREEMQSAQGLGEERDGQGGQGASASEIEKEFQKQEEERIYAAWREWKREEEEKQKKGQGQKGQGVRSAAGANESARSPHAASSAGAGDGLTIKERGRWSRE
ncbi:unnamed protein product [Jaminaea pallidilutea]